MDSHPRFTRRRLLGTAALGTAATALPQTSAFGASHVKADVAVVFRGRLIGRTQAPTLVKRGIPVVEVLTVEPPSTSTADWIRLSNRVAKADLAQVVHALAAWSRQRDTVRTT